MPTVGKREETAAAVSKEQSELADGERIAVIIDKQENFEGDQQVNLQVNGRAISVMRGETVKLTKPYFEALKNAIYTYIKKDEKTGEEKEITVPRYSWRFA